MCMGLILQSLYHMIFTKSIINLVPLQSKSKRRGVKLTLNFMWDIKCARGAHGSFKKNSVQDLS